MNIPRYWARAEGETPPGYEGAHRICVWGWSDESRVHADRHAQQRLTELLDRLHQGLELPRGYAYGDRPAREEILEQLPDRSGAVSGILTRNSYGSVVLNAARVLFVDVDLWPETPLQTFLRWVKPRMPTPEAVTMTRIRETLQNDSGGSYRVYRTAAGFRILATDPVFTAGSPEAEHLMSALLADRSFMQLCRIQESFRARLTPKPWRCGQPKPPGRFPREPEEQAAFAEWLANYERAAERKATCRFIEAVGRGRTHRDAAPIVELHDQRTQSATALPLA